MARFIDAIDLPVPVEDAFHYLADFSNTAEWDPSVESAERLDAGEIGPGSRFRVRVGFAGQTLALDYEITAFEPPTRLVLRGGDAQVESVDEVTLAPREGGTRVTYEARIELCGLRRLADPLVHLLFQRVGQLAARGLRERIHERERSRVGRLRQGGGKSTGRSRRAKSARDGKATSKRKATDHASSRKRVSH
jgi:uncharacterized protein YndB with AHSA1/START domain